MANQKKLGLRGGRSAPSPKRRKRWNPHAKIKNAIRKVFWFSPLRDDALRAAKLQGKDLYLCAMCKRLYPKNQVAVDHIDPVVPIEWSRSGEWDWNIVISRLFCEQSNLQVLHKECHAKKTLAEGVQRGLENESNDGSN